MGNGEQLQCTVVCSQVQLFLGPNKFLVDLFVIPLSGAELVLGVQRLKNLGPIIRDYNKLTTSFNLDGDSVLLMGVPKPGLEETNIHQLQQLMGTNALDTCLHLQLISDDHNSQIPTTTNP